MKFVTHSFVTLAAILPLTQSAYSRPNSSSGPSTKKTCATSYGPRKGPIRTNTRTTTSTISLTSTSITTLVTTLTPALTITTEVSETVSTSVLTLDTPTDVITSTISETSTSVISTTILTTSTTEEVTTTSLVSTSSVGPGPFYTPIVSSLPGAGLKKKRSDPVELKNRSPYAPDRLFQRDPDPKQVYGGPRNPPGQGQGHPTQVQCTVTVYKTVRTTTTSTTLSTSFAPTPILTETITTTSVTVSTLLPEPASTTVFTTETIPTFSTVSTTSTLLQTTTTVTTEYTSTVTSYAACATDNMVGSYNGLGLYGYGYSSFNFQVEDLDRVSVGSLLECCERAAALESSWFFQFFPGEEGPSGNCDVSVGEFCPIPTTTIEVGGEPTYAHATLFGNSNSQPSATLIAGNGNCGVIDRFLSPPPPGKA